MKARVIETDKIEELQVNELNDYFTKDGVHFKGIELDFDYEPDYWDKLKHQAAIAAMQGMLSNCKFPAYSTEGYYKHNIANNSLEYATTLINKLMEEENEK